MTTEDLYSNMHLQDGLYDPAQLVSDFPNGRALDEVNIHFTRSEANGI